MLFRIHLLLAVILQVSSMKMRETVERMVMVRTSGSDLQPEATGYIYKKKNDGEESVIEMGESEVMEHLAKYYKQPKSYNEQSHVDGNAKEGEKNKVAPKEDGRVIPVSEESDEKVDGLASDDFKKYLEKYGVKFDDHDNYDHYSSGPGDFVGGYYHGYGDDGKDNKNKKNHHHYGAGDYHNGKYEGYTYSHKEGDEDDKKESDANKENDELKLNKQNESQDGNNEKVYARFQKTYDNDKKDRKYHDRDDGEKFAFYKYGGGSKYGDDHGYGHISHQAGDDDANNGKASEESGAHGTKDSAEEQAESDEKQQHYGSEGSKTYGKSFSFKVKHY